MKILLTGGTGYIGSALLDQLVQAQHEVVALVRSDRSAADVRDRGATPVVGDLLDTDWVATQLAEVEGAIHTASPGDATSEAVDRSLATAAVRAFAGTTRPYVHTGGIWVYGKGDAITEDAAYDPPALTAWRKPVEDIVLTADLVGSVVVPGIVYGYGAGIPAMVTSADRTADGALALVGDGSQHWTTVHVDDVAALFVTVLTSGAAQGRVLAVSGDNPTVRELGEAYAGQVAPESAEESRARFGALFADALLLDQQATGAKARSLGWQPQGATLVEELRTGSYAA